MTDKQNQEVVVSKEQETLPAAVNLQQLSPIEMALQLKQSGMTTEDMKQMLELQKDFEANEARKEFNVAFALFKADPPDITKNKTVKFNDTQYTHASLDHVASAISERMSAHGLSFSWKTNQAEGGIIEVICTVSHRLGHSESTSLTSLPDSSGKKNSIQSIGSTITYLQRYTLLALTGTATRDMDDDGAVAGDPIEYITKEQVLELVALIDEVGATETSFLQLCKIDCLENMPAVKLANAIKRLEEKRNV